jgi:hypothetical protein
MKAHRVACQRCANGVTVVIARRVDHDETADVTEVFAGQLTQDEATTAMTEILLAQVQSDEAAYRAEHPYIDRDEPITAHDIMHNWTFHLESKRIRAI